MIQYGKQSINRSDLDAVSQALQSGWLTTGPKVSEFEERFAEAVNAKHAVAVCNATSALHLAMLAAEIGENDRVLTSPNTFVSSANCIAFVGATPDFVDIDPISYTLCPESLQQSWKNDVKAVVAVDYAGQTAEMPAIANVARERGGVVIEDACHAIGGSFLYGNKRFRVGGHPWADMTTFSFHPVKTMTTGEGGMVVTDSDHYACQLRLLRTHGITRDAKHFTGLGAPEFDERGPWYYEMQGLGFNYRLTDFQSALGLSQLGRLDQFVAKRREVVQRYNEAFEGIEAVTTPGLRNLADRPITSWHLYTIQVDFKRFGTTRTDFMASLAKRGVGSQVLYIPVHLQPWYRKTYGYQVGKCPEAESFYLKALSLPLFPDMTDSDQAQVIDAVMELCSNS